MFRFSLLALFSVFYSTILTSQSFLDPNQANELAKSGKAIIVDIREQSEWQQSGLAEPALWLAYSSIRSQDDDYKTFLNKYDPTKTIIFYCRSGSRASKAVTRFEALGYKAVNMGGLVHWQRAGLPVKYSS